MAYHKLSDLARSYVQGKLPMDLGYADRMVFEKPIGWILRGLAFEPSAFEKGIFHAVVFVMPTPSPTEDAGVTFNFGTRLGWLCKDSDVWWHWQGERAEIELAEFEDCVKRHVPRFWNTHGTSKRLLASHRRFTLGAPTTSQSFDLVKCAVIEGSRIRAWYYSTRLYFEFWKSNPKFDCDAKRVELTKALMATFRRSHDEALKMLADWRKNFLARTGLAEFAEEVQLNYELE